MTRANGGASVVTGWSRLFLGAHYKGTGDVEVAASFECR